MKDDERHEKGPVGPVPMSKYSSPKSGCVYKELSPGGDPVPLSRRVFKQTIEMARRVGGLLFLPPQIVNPLRDGGCGSARFILIPPEASGGRPALLDSRSRAPLSLGELDDSDSRVCIHDRRVRCSQRLAVFGRTRPTP